MTDRICTVEGCERRRIAKGLCDPCYRRVRRGATSELPLPWPESLFARLDVVNSPADCWNWTGCLSQDGYGRVGHNRTQIGVHRAVYIELVGEIPAGMTLDHRCFNRRCANPDHLEVVPQSVNAKRARWTHDSGYASRDRCISGQHDITLPNAYRVNRKTGWKTCRECDRLSWARARAKRKAQ